MFLNNVITYLENLYEYRGFQCTRKQNSMPSIHILKAAVINGYKKGQNVRALLGNPHVNTRTMQVCFLKETVKIATLNSHETNCGKRLYQCSAENSHISFISLFTRINFMFFFHVSS